MQRYHINIRRGGSEVTQVQLHINTSLSDYNSRKTRSTRKESVHWNRKGKRVGAEELVEVDKRGGGWSVGVGEQQLRR